MTSRSYMNEESTTQRRLRGGVRAWRHAPGTVTSEQLWAPAAARLFGEHHRVVGEGLQFQRIPRRIEEKARGLLAGLPAKADLRLDNEAHLRLLQLGRDR